MIRSREPQSRQFALVSDLLDLAHLSVLDEAVLAPSWIKEQPEGLVLPNLALASTIQPVTDTLSPDVQHVVESVNNWPQHSN